MVSINNKLKTIHRLVAEAFIPNPSNLPYVNHIDGNKLNNNLSNLEWCTQKHNMQEAWKNGLCKNNSYFAKRKKVVQYDLKGNYIKEFSSILNAEKETKVHSGSISRVCKCKGKSAGGYIWKYKEN